MTRPAVAYYRTSSNTNVGDDKDTLKRQMVACRRYADANDYVIAEGFYDAGVCGADPLTARDGFKNLLSYCEENGIETIICENATRFARDLITQELGYRMLTESGFRLIAADSPESFTDDSPTTKLIRQVLGAVAEHQKDELVLKMKGARDRKRVMNKDQGIVTLAGKGKCEGRKSYQESNPDLVAATKTLYRKNRKTHRRMPLRKIADALFEMGYMTKTGKPFGPAQIKNILL
jgi:DNA invertase Pin-like site-specific DNA recombinase